jgi:hypothetical protein
VPVRLLDYHVLTQQVQKLTAIRSGQSDLQGSHLAVFICSERRETKEKEKQYKAIYNGQYFINFITYEA